MRTKEHWRKEVMDSLVDAWAKQGIVSGARCVDSITWAGETTTPHESPIVSLLRDFDDLRLAASRVVRAFVASEATQGERVESIAALRDLIEGETT